MNITRIMKKPRVRAFMLGYYEAKQEHGAALSDVALDEMCIEYRAELAVRAEEATRGIK